MLGSINVSVQDQGVGALQCLAQKHLDIFLLCALVASNSGGCGKGERRLERLRGVSLISGDGMSRNKPLNMTRIHPIDELM